MNLTEYFTDKIERRLSFYEERSRLIDARYAAQIERRVRRLKADDVLANFFRNTVNPRRIEAEIDDIRTLLQAGSVIDADRSLERLQTNLEFVENHLRHPIFTLGLKQTAALDRRREGANAKSRAAAAPKHRRWLVLAETAWRSRRSLSVEACARYVIANCKEKDRAAPKTIADVIRNRKPKKAGGPS